MICDGGGAAAAAAGETCPNDYVHSKTVTDDDVRDDDGGDYAGRMFSSGQCQNRCLRMISL